MFTMKVTVTRAKTQFYIYESLNKKLIYENLLFWVINLS